MGTGLRISEALSTTEQVKKNYIIVSGKEIKKD